MRTVGDCLSALFVSLAAIIISTSLWASTGVRLFPGFIKSQLANVGDPTKMRAELIESFPGSLVRQVIESWKH
jgi:hypothetical protein